MFNRPYGLAVSDRDEIAVTDYWNHRVQIFNSSGNFIRSFGRQGTNEGEFKFPCGICFDNNRNIFVADKDNHRIQLFNGEGEYRGKFVISGKLGNSLDSQLHPWGLSLDSDGNVIVADSGNKLIKIFSPEGKFVRQIDRAWVFSFYFSFSFHCVQCNEYLIVSDCHDH